MAVEPFNVVISFKYPRARQSVRRLPFNLAIPLLSVTSRLSGGETDRSVDSKMSKQNESAYLSRNPLRHLLLDGC